MILKSDKAFGPDKIRNLLIDKKVKVKVKLKDKEIVVIAVVVVVREDLQERKKKKKKKKKKEEANLGESFFLEVNKEEEKYGCLYIAITSSRITITNS